MDHQDMRDVMKLANDSFNEGILRGLEMAAALLAPYPSDGRNALDDLIAKHKEGK